MKMLKWFKSLNFPAEWYDEVAKAAEDYNCCSDPVTPMDNLLNALSRCDETAEKYKKLGIDDKILFDTLSDILIWAENYYLSSGRIGLTETPWINNHLNAELFRLGRLQFKTGKMNESNIIEVHIPQGESLSREKYLSSFKNAISFYERFFPDYKYEYFTCDSWLLDKNLKNFLRPDSNILKFQSEFDMISYTESDSVLRYLSETKLKQVLENYIKSGGKLYCGYGIVPKERFY